MSSDTDMESGSGTPPKTSNPPCMFTVEQFQLAAPSQETDSESSNVYVVRPTAIWDSLQPFQQVVVEDDRYLLHETVTIPRHDLPNSPLWTAHILEIRGSKRLSQVFIRVFWFYQPSQLPPTLIHPYHGRRELLASNSMSVIDATALVKRTHVSHWHEEHESVPPAAGLFWRQTYDVLAQKLSPLHTPCQPPCIQHHNPDDDPLLHCPLPACNARMHKSCILDSTLARVKSIKEAANTKKTEKVASMIDPGEKSATRAVEAISSQKNRKKMKKVPSMTAEWFDEGSDDYGVWIKEGGSVEWVEDVRCLGCGGVWPFLSALKGS